MEDLTNDDKDFPLLNLAMCSPNFDKVSDLR